MKALEFNGKQLELVQRPRPRRARNAALVRVLLAGICNTDLEIVRGYMGFRGVLGHEFVGIVQAAPDPDLVGKRVVGEINAGCGRCELCRSGLARHCATRTTLGIMGRHGAFAEYLSLPAGNLHLVPDSISDRAATFVEPLAAACEILEQLRIDPGCRTLIVGDGKLGLLVAQVLCGAGAKVTLLGKHPSNMRRIAGRSIRRVELSRFKPRPIYDLTIEASGSPAGWDLARRCTRPRGTLVLKSTYAGSFEFNPAPLVIDELTVVGSRCGPFGPALELLASGAAQVEGLIDAEYDLEDWRTAFERAVKRGTLKVLLRIGAC